MEWTVVVVLIALTGLVISVLTPAIRLNTSVTKLSTLVETLDAKIGAMDAENSDSHRRIWNELDGYKSALGNHETRITVLEKRG
jgi:hypothetical protein